MYTIYSTVKIIKNIGTFQASSFCERINSCANHAFTTGNTALDSKNFSILVVLKMNREFMGFMRENYSEVSNLHLRMAVMAAVDN
jgi:hypothetical protein